MARRETVSVYNESLEYIGAVTAGIMQPLTWREWNDMDRNDIDRMWDAWLIVQDVRSEREEQELETDGYKPADRTKANVEDTLAELMRMDAT